MTSVAVGKLGGESSMAVLPMTGRRRRTFHRVDPPAPHPNPNEDDIFYGESDEDDGSTINLIACGASDNPKVCGSMNDVTKGYTYNFRHDADGEPVVVETPYLTYPPEGDPPEVEVEIDDAEGGGRTLLGLRGPPPQHPKHESSQRRSLQSAAPLMDVLVIYSPASECRLSSQPVGCARNSTTRQNMLNEISVAFAETNNAYAASGVDGRIRLVHAHCAEGYVESEFSPYSNAYSAALYRMRSSSDGYLDEIHPSTDSDGLRAQYKADMVAMIIDDGFYCGIGFRPSSPSASYMYSVSSWECFTAYYTFGHELGHNQGCRHDRGTSGICNPDDVNGNYGYRHPEGRWRTILAYTCQTGECDNNPLNGCSRIQRFSSSTLQYGGYATGSAGGMGTIGKIDNDQQINEVAGIIEGFYNACVADGDCDDRDLCTVDRCESGVCTFVEISCDDSDGCTTDRCNSTTGACFQEPVVCSGGANCTAGSCPAVAASCMSGRTGVIAQAESTRIVKVVQDLRVGDEIQGLDEKKELMPCTVEAVGHFGQGPVFGNYTSDHYILNAAGTAVSVHGEFGAEEDMDKYAVLTSCPAGIDESGTGFTPLDSDFFGVDSGGVSWSDYVLIHAAILLLVRESGTFWFSPSTYSSMSEVRKYTPAFYRTILQCAKDPSDCDELEVAASDLVENSLSTEAKKKAKQAFPLLGRSKEAGSVAAVVSRGKSGKSYSPPLSAQAACPERPLSGGCSNNCHCPSSFCQGNGHCH